MPVRDSSKKAVRHDKKRTTVNGRRKDAMKKAVKEIKSLVADGNITEAKTKLPAAQKAIDKAAKDNVIHENKAARKKSQLAALVDTAGE
jgi:small subunit ribosomal protein S20